MVDAGLRTYQTFFKIVADTRQLENDATLIIYGDLKIPASGEIRIPSNSEVRITR